jgi:hypothetical protein
MQEVPRHAGHSSDAPAPSRPALREGSGGEGPHTEDCIATRARARSRFGRFETQPSLSRERPA